MVLLIAYQVSFLSIENRQNKVKEKVTQRHKGGVVNRTPPSTFDTTHPLD